MEKLYNPNPSAGDILKDEFIYDIGLRKLALGILMPIEVIEDVIEGKEKVTASLDAKLCDYFVISEGYFLRLQEKHEEMEKKSADEGF